MGSYIDYCALISASIFTFLFFFPSVVNCRGLIDIEEISKLNTSTTRHHRHKEELLAPKLLPTFRELAYASKYIIVDKQGKGQFQSIQAAVDAVPGNNRQWVVIQINAGVYKWVCFPNNFQGNYLNYGLNRSMPSCHSSLAWHDHWISWELIGLT